MNFFSEIEGLQGENLTTAVLCFLLRRSQDLRDRFVGLVSAKCHLGPLTLENRFSCTREYQTKNQEHGSGRIDVLLEIDDAVIGIENKLLAGFQPGQPDKYLESIKKRAEELSSPRMEVRYLVVILAPEKRDNEIKKKIEKNPHYVSLSWQDILQNLDKFDNGLNAQLDDSTCIILSLLKQFVTEQIAFMPKFAEWFPHFSRQLDTPIQRDLLRNLLDFFPAAENPRVSSSKAKDQEYVGYNFCSKSFWGQRRKGWYGFVRRSFIQEPGQNEAELIIVTTFPVTFNSGAFRRVRLVNENFFNDRPPVEQHAWVVGYDANWKESEKWRGELSPLNEAVAELARLNDLPSNEQPE